MQQVYCNFLTCMLQGNYWLHNIGVKYHTTIETTNCSSKKFAYQCHFFFSVKTTPELLPVLSQPWVVVIAWFYCVPTRSSCRARWCSHSSLIPSRDDSIRSRNCFTRPSSCERQSNTWRHITWLKAIDFPTEKNILIHMDVVSSLNKQNN